MAEEHKNVLILNGVPNYKYKNVSKLTKFVKLSKIFIFIKKKVVENSSYLLQFYQNN